MNNNNNSQITSTTGKYQVEYYGNGAYDIVVLNTETGVMKTYYKSTNGWTENFTGLPVITFTH
jgi:hypothetical protein